MAGYAADFSKSRNAMAAEANDCLPATALAKRLGIKAGAIKALMTPNEWHHTSGWFNRTDYYDGALLLAIADGRDVAEIHDTEDIAEARALLLRLRAWRPAVSAAVALTGCTVRWTEWSGTRTRPKATERQVEGCTVVAKGGTMVTIRLPDGSEMAKKLGAAGLVITRPGYLHDSRGLPTFDAGGEDR